MKKIPLSFGLHTDDAPRATAGDIVRRTALSFFLFAAVLTTLLTLSWYVLIPKLTQVEVGGSVRGLSEIRGYKTTLEAQISTLEKERGTFLLPVKYDLYQRLKNLKSERQKFQQIRSDLNHAILTLVPNQKNVVKLTKLYFDASKSTAEIRGSIENVGPRSMTVLAQFIESIDRIPQVIHIESSRYTRLQHDDGSFYSPFTIVLTIR